MDYELPPIAESHKWAAPNDLTTTHCPITEQQHPTTNNDNDKGRVDWADYEPPPIAESRKQAAPNDNDKEWGEHTRHL